MNQRRKVIQKHLLRSKKCVMRHKYNTDLISRTPFKDFIVFLNTIEESSLSYNIPSPNLVRASCQYVLVKPDKPTIALHIRMQTISMIFLLRLGRESEAKLMRTPVTPKTTMNIGPAKSSYSTPVPEYCQKQSDKLRPGTLHLYGETKFITNYKSFMTTPSMGILNVI